MPKDDSLIRLVKYKQKERFAYRNRAISLAVEPQNRESYEGRREAEQFFIIQLKKENETTEKQSSLSVFLDEEAITK